MMRWSNIRRVKVQTELLHGRLDSDCYQILNHILPKEDYVILFCLR